MAPLMEMTRKNQKTPVMTQNERNQNFGTQIPRVPRAHAIQLPSTPKPASSRYPYDDEIPARTHTDDLEEPITRMPTRSGNGNGGTPPRQTQTTYNQEPRFVLTRSHVGAILGLGAIGVFIIYTVLYWICLIGLALVNLCSYGPVHTSQIDTTLSTKPARIIATNSQGTITLNLLERNADGTLSSRTFIKNDLDPNAWGNMDAIVVTLEVLDKQTAPHEHTYPPQTIAVHLVGEINYWRPFFLNTRPTMTLHLVPDSRGNYTLTT